jgi:hypothetical protein
MNANTKESPEMKSAFIQMDKFHAELRFHARREVVRFTATTLELLMVRFAAEVDKEHQRRNEAREYTIIIPNLTTEWCRSWAEFNQYEHCS